MDAGAHTIAWHLSEKYQLRVSEATIWRTLQRAGLIIPEPNKKPKAAYICFAAELPNEMWQVDFTHYRPTRPDGTPSADAEILCFLDDHSRYALSVTCHQPVTGPAVVTAFQQTIAGRAGRDTINGFQSELRRLGVTQKHSRPNHPTTCGKVERFHQTLKKWLTAQPRQAQTLAELQALCDQFLASYNTQRPHRSLNGKTPLGCLPSQTQSQPNRLSPSPTPSQGPPRCGRQRRQTHPSPRGPARF